MSWVRRLFNRIFRGHVDQVEDHERRKAEYLTRQDRVLRRLGWGWDAIRREVDKDPG